MNLTPRWIPLLQRDGHEALHWSNIGAFDAPDHTIMAWAVENNYTVLTNDLDFTTLLATTQASGPSVIQIRAQDVLPESIGNMVLQALRRFEPVLVEGALISVDPARVRAHILPFTI